MSSDNQDFCELYKKSMKAMTENFRRSDPSKSPLAIQEFQKNQTKLIELQGEGKAEEVVHNKYSEDNN